MPQVKESLIRRLIKKALNEAELAVGDDNTTFNIKVSVSNPQSETKLGIRIQLKPKSEQFLFTDSDKKAALSVAIMKKLNTSLGEFDIQVSKDTDAETQDPTVLGFFIPLSQIKNMIVKSLGGKSTPNEDDDRPSPKPPSPPLDMVAGAPDDLPPDDKGLEERLLNEAMRQRTLNEISGIVLKEDYYGFINAGNNMLRSMEGRFEMREAKKYLEYLVKNNIM